MHTANIWSRQFELAVYLGGLDAQKAHYEMRNVIPCNTELLKDKEVASDELVQAQNNTFNNTSVLQPFVSAIEQLLDTS